MFKVRKSPLVCTGDYSQNGFTIRSVDLLIILRIRFARADICVSETPPSGSTRSVLYLSAFLFVDKLILVGIRPLKHGRAIKQRSARANNDLNESINKKNTRIRAHADLYSSHKTRKADNRVAVLFTVKIKT